jgi:hypothetical protein
MQAAGRERGCRVSLGSGFNRYVYGNPSGTSESPCVWRGPRVCGPRRAEWRRLLCPKCRGTLRAGTNHAQLFVAVNSGVMSIRKVNLNRVAPHRRSGLRLRFGFEHRKQWRTSGYWHSRRSCSSFSFRFPFFLVRFFFPCVVARGAWAGIAQVRKVVVAAVPVSPGDIHARAVRDVNFYRGRLFAWVKRRGHFYDRCKCS